MADYWVVGARFGGQRDQSKKFIQQGIWMLGHEKGTPDYNKALKMKPGDRIAIKTMKGRAQKGIKIHHIGIIKEQIKTNPQLISYAVNWVATDLARDVESKGCFGSVHGPYSHNEWIEKVFCL